MNTEVHLLSCSTADAESFTVGERANIVSSFVGDRDTADREGEAPNAGESLPGDGQNNVSEADDV